MLFRLKIITTSSMTIEQESREGALERAKHYEREFNSHHHHGEKTVVEVESVPTATARSVFDRCSEHRALPSLPPEETSPSTKKRVVWCQEWEESERGWGVRPDGFTLHLERADIERHLLKVREDELKRNGEGVVPDEYSRPSGDPYQTEIDEKVALDLARRGVMHVRKRPVPLRRT